MQYFVILTVAIPDDSSQTAAGIITFPKDVTRADIFNHVRQAIIDRHGQRFDSANVVFFSAEPNKFGS